MPLKPLLILMISFFAMIVEDNFSPNSALTFTNTSKLQSESPLRTLKCKINTNLSCSL